MEKCVNSTCYFCLWYFSSAPLRSSYAQGNLAITMTPPQLMREMAKACFLRPYGGSKREEEKLGLRTLPKAALCYRTLALCFEDFPTTASNVRVIRCFPNIPRPAKSLALMIENMFGCYFKESVTILHSHFSSAALAKKYKFGTMVPGTCL